MKRHATRFGAGLCAVGALALLPLAFAPPKATARDTDLYKEPEKQNAYILLDTSLSMVRAVYEDKVDYAAYYDTMMTRHDKSIKDVRALLPNGAANLANNTSYRSKGVYIFDSARGRDLIANGPDDEHGLHYERDRVYLVQASMGGLLTVIDNPDGSGTKSLFVADAANATWNWWSKDSAKATGNWRDALIARDMKARIENGELVIEDGSPLSLSNGDDGQVLFQGEILPWGADLDEHEWLTVGEGSTATKVDIGFAGTLVAPGYTYSGYVTAPSQGAQPYTGAPGNGLAATDAAYALWKQVRCEWIECDANYEPKRDADDNRIPKLTLQQFADTNGSSWADMRFRFNGLNWRNWKRGAYVDAGWAGGTGANMRRSVYQWTAKDWANFIAHLDYGTRIVVEDENGKTENGVTLMGRWAYNFYTNNRGNTQGVTADVQPEKQLWATTYAPAKWRKATGGGSDGYFFVTGNYLNFIQCQTLRYIESPGLSKSLYPPKQDGSNGTKDYTMYVEANGALKHETYPAPEPAIDNYYADSASSYSYTYREWRASDYVLMHSETKTKQGGDIKPLDACEIRIDGNCAYYGVGHGYYRWIGNGDRTVTADASPLWYEDFEFTDGNGEKVTYRFQTRFEVAKEAIAHVVEKFSGSMNWGLTTFSTTGDYSANGNRDGMDRPSDHADGWTSFVPLAPTGDPVTQNLTIRSKLYGADGLIPKGGTPLMESFQDTWYSGFHQLTREETVGNATRPPVLGDEESCAKNFIISLTDGVPSSQDTNNSSGNCLVSVDRVYQQGCTKNSPIIPFNSPVFPKTPSWGTNKGTGFQNWDGDTWLTEPVYAQIYESIYDDVAEYAYTHDFKTGEEICNPHADASGMTAADCKKKLDESVMNVKSHHIGFSSKQGLLRDAAESAGGYYMVASNRDQLIAIFEALANSMTESVSFSAPAVSASASDRLASGSEMYTNAFIARTDQPWVGNVKKFRMGDCPTSYEVAECIYGGASAPLTDREGQFKDGLDYWGIANATPTFHDADGNELTGDQAPKIDDGAGEVLLRDVAANFAGGNYYARAIYTAKESGGVWEMVKFDRSIAPEMLGLDDDDTAGRDKLVNFIHGYTYDARADGSPVRTRDWPLGAILHSQPTAVDYYQAAENENGDREIKRRYVVVGSNDAMLHVFDDSKGTDYGTGSGREVFAFIPPDLLKLSDREKHRLMDIADEALTFRPGLNTTKLSDERREELLDMTDAEFIEALAQIERDMSDKGWVPQIGNRRPKKAYDLPTTPMFDGVDGGITVVRGGVDEDEATEREDDEDKLQPTRLIFGERRGGGNYWCLNIEADSPVASGQTTPNWQVAWNFAPEEIAQSWSDVITGRVLTDIDPTTGRRTYRRVAVFSGGYDPVEDNFPEKFADDKHSTPLKADGTVDFELWRPTPVHTDATGAQQARGWGGKRLWKKTEWDANANGEYDIYNPNDDGYGRGIWVVDLKDPAKVSNYGDMQVLPFSVTGVKCEPRYVNGLPVYKSNGDPDMACETEVTTGAEQKRADMRFSIPASPSVAADTDTYFDEDGKRDTRLNVLRALYVPDIYANMWKVRQNLRAVQNCQGTWMLKGLNHVVRGLPGDDECAETPDEEPAGWVVRQIFTTEAKDLTTGERRFATVNSSVDDPCRTAGARCDLDETPEETTSWNAAGTQAASSPKRDFDRGQKAFYGPTISWGGVKDYFDPGNFNRVGYLDPETGDREVYSFLGRDDIAALFYGTGDPEHPNYTITHNRLYNIYDDSTISAEKEVTVDPRYEPLPPVTATLPGEDGDYELTVGGDQAEVEINLTRDYVGTITVPANVKRVTINTNGFTLSGANGDVDSYDGKAALNLANASTEVVVTGGGTVKGGDGVSSHIPGAVTANLNDKCELRLSASQQQLLASETENWVLDLRLYSDCEGTFVVPDYVKAVGITMNGHKIEAEDGQPAIRLESPKTRVYIKGEGKLEGGDGKDGQDGGDVIAGADVSTLVVVHGGEVEMEPGKGDGDGQDGEIGATLTDGSTIPPLAPSVGLYYPDMLPTPAGDGGQAIAGANGGTAIYTNGGATVTGGAGGTRQLIGNNRETGKPGGICGLDAANAEICSTKEGLPDEGSGSGSGDGSGGDGSGDGSASEGFSVKALYTEADLMNLTCGELDDETDLRCYLSGVDCDADAETASNRVKDRLMTLLTDDAVINDGTSPPKLETAATDDDFKGKVIVLDRQADATYCNHVTGWRNSVDKEGVDNHKGEQVMARTTLLNGVVYFTSFQPKGAADNDPCKRGGNGRLYSMDYSTGASIRRSTRYVYEKENYGDAVGLFKFYDMGDSPGIPSGVSISQKAGGIVSGRASFGSMMAGPEDSSKQGLDAWDSNPPLNLFYWRDTNSRNPFPHYFDLKE